MHLLILLLPQLVAEQCSARRAWAPPGTADQRWCRGQLGRLRGRCSHRTGRSADPRQALMPGPDDAGPGDEKNETHAVIGGGRLAQSEGTGEGT
eukprot:1406452-Pyramimonas_sp.AAC.1